MSLGVLLVEDDRELRTTLRDALKVEGYRVFSSASLADARAVISNALAQGGLDIMLLITRRELQPLDVCLDSRGDVLKRRLALATSDAVALDIATRSLAHIRTWPSGFIRAAGTHKQRTHTPFDFPNRERNPRKVQRARASERFQNLLRARLLALIQTFHAPDGNPSTGEAGLTHTTAHAIQSPSGRDAVLSCLRLAWIVSDRGNIQQNRSASAIVDEVEHAVFVRHGEARLVELDHGFGLLAVVQGRLRVRLQIAKSLVALPAVPHRHEQGEAIHHTDLPCQPRCSSDQILQGIKPPEARERDAGEDRFFNALIPPPGTPNATLDACGWSSKGAENW